MSDRIILHCDLNNFFASVSLLSNSTLYDLPVAVCGSELERHGIVLAKNEAAKKYGVKTAEAVWEARLKCPDLVILKPDYEKYYKYSAAAHRIYERYTDLIEPFGIDECWLDVTGSTMLFGRGRKIADRIRGEIKMELGITASVGVSFNKVFAKLGSDMKKPDGTTVISRENFHRTVWPLPVSVLLFVGKNTAARLNQIGVFTVGDLTCCEDATLTRLLGKNGILLKKYALGADDSPVIPSSENDIPKSIGKSITPNHDITDRDEVWRIYLELSEHISAELHKKNLYAYCVQIHIRDTSLKAKESSRTFNSPVNTALGITKKGMELFDESYRFNLPLRSVGIRVTSLRNENAAQQIDFFGSFADEERDEQIENSVYAVREKFGSNSVKRGRIINTKEMMQENQNQS